MSVRGGSERLHRYPTIAASIGGKVVEWLAPSCMPCRAGWEVCRCWLWLTMFERASELPIQALGMYGPKQTQKIAAGPTIVLPGAEVATGHSRKAPTDQVRGQKGVGACVCISTVVSVTYRGSWNGVDR